MAIVVLAVLGGLAARLWMIFHGTSNSDNDVEGLIAQAGLHGHFQAFFGGQNYGGTAEPYLISVAFAAFGQNILVAQFVLLVLAAVAALLVWRIVFRLVGNGAIAALAGAMAWGAPAASFRVSTYLFGFRSVTLVCGLAVVLLSLRVLQSDDGPRFVDLVLLGLSAGIGWWSSPELAYYLPTASIVLVMAFAATTRPRLRRWAGPLLAGVGAFAVGALPWIWANVQSGLASLNQAPYQRFTHVTYGGRVRLAVEDLLPLELGLRRGGAGTTLFGHAYPVVFGLGVAVVVVSLVLCVMRGGGALALAVGVVAFPFIYAVSPLSWFWQDGRYGIYLAPLLTMVIAVGVSEAGRRLKLGPTVRTSAMAVVVLVALGLAAYGSEQTGIPFSASGFSAGWGNPDDPTLALVAQLEQDGVHTGYASYWVAYKLDFASRGRLQITTAGSDNDRSPTIDAAVRHSDRPAFFFVSPSDAPQADAQFSATQAIVGPNSVDEAYVRSRLDALGVHYRVIDTGLVTVLLPDRTVTPAEVGIYGKPPNGS